MKKLSDSSPSWPRLLAVGGTRSSTASRAEKPTVNYATVSHTARSLKPSPRPEHSNRSEDSTSVRRSGTVKDIYADFNSLVKKGDLLAEIDPQSLQVQVDVQRPTSSAKATSPARKSSSRMQKKLRAHESLFEKGLQNQQQDEAGDLGIKTRDAHSLLQKAIGPGGSGTSARLA